MGAHNNNWDDTVAMQDNSSGAPQPGGPEYSEVVEVSFHGEPYIITVSTLHDDTLCVEVEQKADASRWRGDFTARYIEDITSKTGNYKRFPVFVKMLVSALRQASDSVFVDLLSYADLEALKARKAGAAPPLAKALAPNNKRYLILTYAAEFDRVHYPLPLLFEEHPDPNQLKSVIASLRAELESLKGHGAPPGGWGAGRTAGARGAARSAVQADEHAAVTAAGVPGAAAEVRRLRDENDRLRRELQRQLEQLAGGEEPPSARTAGHAPRAAAEARELARELRAVVRERDALGARVEALEADAERERGLHRRELRRRAKENQEAYEELARSRNLVRELRQQVRAMAAELEARGRPPSATDRLRAAYGTSGPATRPRPASQRPSRSSSPGGWAPPAPPGYGPARGRGTASRERGVGASSTSSRPASAPTSARGYGASAGGRFDPTAYVRQRQEALDSRRSTGSGASSRAPTPPRSGPASARSSPAASRPPSAERTRVRGATNATAAAPRPVPVGGRSGPQSPMAYGVGVGAASAAGWSKFPPLRGPPGGAGSGPGSAAGGAFPGSRPQSAGRSSSPGRALQEVKKKLGEFVARRPEGPSPATALVPAAPAESSSSKTQLFDEASADIADIDSRLQALQAFLRMAKASSGPTPPLPA